MQTHRWASWPAFGVAALSALLLAAPADAQWRGDGARRRPPEYYAHRSAGYAQGFEDGYDKGRDDAKDRDRYDVRRHKDYRNADHGYNKRYGPKDFYKRDYRAGFEDGYSRGYREVARHGRGHSSRGPWWWPRD